MKNKPAIDFYFDLTSPYSYVAAELIEEIAAAGHRAVHYKPTSLAFVFKATDNTPPMATPAKAVYMTKDFPRTARFYNLKLNWPKQFPTNSLCATRAILKLHDQAPTETGHFVRALFQAYFVRGQDIATPEGVAHVADFIGLNGAELAQANDDPVYKDKARLAVQESLDAGAFGAPFFVVDGETFWGHDRMEQLRRWVVQGPY